MSYYRTTLLAALSAACILSLGSAAPAAILYWDTDDATGLQPGDGVWSTSVTNWNPDLSGNDPREIWTNASDAVILNASQTITIDGTVQANSIATQDGGIGPTVLAGGILQLSGSGLIHASGGSGTGASTPRIAVSAQVSGSVGVTKAGTRLVTLTNSDNDYTGPTAVQEGQLEVMSGVLPETTVAQISSATSLIVHGVQTFAGLEGSGNVVMNASGNKTLNIGMGDVSSTYDGAVQSSANPGSSRLFHVNKIGAGTLVFNGDSRTGNLSVDGGGTFVINGEIIHHPNHRSAAVLDGTLVVNGVLIGSVSDGGSSSNPANNNSTVVEALGTLAGGGTIGGDVTVNGGTISPGPGTLTVGGLTLNEGSTITFELGSLADSLVVEGQLTGPDADGGVTLEVLAGDGFAMNVPYVLIDWTGGSAPGLSVDDFFVVSDIVGSLAITGQSLTFTGSVIPEPSTLALLALGALTFPRRRRRR